MAKAHVGDRIRITAPTGSAKPYKDQETVVLKVEEHGVQAVPLGSMGFFWHEEYTVVNHLNILRKYRACFEVEAIEWTGENYNEFFNLRIPGSEIVLTKDSVTLYIDGIEVPHGMVFLTRPDNNMWSVYESKEKFFEKFERGNG